MSLASLLGLSLALHLYIGARLVPALPSALGAAALAVVLVLSAVLVPLGLLARRLARPPASDQIAWAGMLCLGLFSSLLVLTLVRDVVLLAVALVSLAAPVASYALRTGTAVAVPVLAVLLTGVGLANARRIARPSPSRSPSPASTRRSTAFASCRSPTSTLGPRSSRTTCGASSPR